MTHGLCGKEGAMVFKRVLKGIGRLMLTTAVMCGVGLFLCSSEVKAEIKDPVIGITNTNNTGVDDTRFNVTITNKNTEASGKITVKKVELCEDTACSSSVASFTLSSELEIVEGADSTFSISNSDFIKNAEYSKLTSGTISIKGVRITYDSDTQNKTMTKDCGSVIPAITSNTLYKISIPKLTKDGGSSAPYDTNASYSDSNFTIKVGDRTGDRTYEAGKAGYGYAGESVLITPSGNPDYYINYYTDSTDVPTWDSGKFSEPETPYSVDNLNGDVTVNVQYFPKFNDVWFETTGSTNVYLDDDGKATYTSLAAKFDNDKLNSSGNDRNIIMSNMVIVPELTDTGSTNIAGDAWSSVGGTSSTKIDFGTLTRHALSDINSPGIAKVKAIALKPNGGNGETPPINPVETKSSDKYLSLNVYAQPTGILLQNVPISVMAGGNATTVKIFNGIEPGGANQNPSIYAETLTVTPSEVLDKSSTNFKYNAATGEVTVKASSTATSGATATVTLTLDNGITTPIYKSFEVKIISFDKDKTISSIKNSNKNYITYNKDKGYSLDIKQLIIDNAKDSSGNSITIDKNQITEVKVGSTSCSEGTWKPSEAALNQKVSCKINGVKIEESDGLKVSAYPMPTATYSSSNRTLSVKIPTKVATAYSDDNNIRQSKGFKLILEDSSGNTLYEYTDSKYQNVLSSSSESTVTYTVTATDIEGMITSAASNGKFSADTTSVKFKVIPMGYKQSSTSDETIKAKDEIAGKTDAVTVYKVSASGTNFTSSAAYGLDGQTVSITATPNSGYSFKQWSDGNTSNPRQVKVSASGTRSFQAVAGDRVANSTGAGGTDNSELYDDVPKTAESNSAIWLIVFMVFAVMGTTYALYLQLRAANSKHDR